MPPLLCYTRREYDTYEMLVMVSSILEIRQR